MALLKVCFLQGRVDDNIDTIRKRLKVFADSHHPVIEYYLKKGKLYKVVIEFLITTFWFCIEH